jgi:hypothetical protein
MAPECEHLLHFNRRSGPALQAAETTEIILNRSLGAHERVKHADAIK